MAVTGQRYDDGQAVQTPWVDNRLAFAIIAAVLALALAAGAFLLSGARPYSPTRADRAVAACLASTTSNDQTYNQSATTAWDDLVACTRFGPATPAGRCIAEALNEQLAARVEAASNVEGQALVYRAAGPCGRQ